MDAPRKASDILNTVRNNASEHYRGRVPVAQPTKESVREVYAIIIQSSALLNELLNGLVNYMDRVLIEEKGGKVNA